MPGISSRGCDVHLMFLSWQKKNMNLVIHVIRHQLYKMMYVG